jgi:hypothetical protein
MEMGSLKYLPLLEIIAGTCSVLTKGTECLKIQSFREHGSGQKVYFFTRWIEFID